MAGLARWCLGVHAFLVVSLVALFAVVAVGSEVVTVEWDTDWIWLSLGLLLVGSMILGAPWTLMGEPDLLGLAPLLNLALQAALWGAVIVARRARRTRRHP